MAHGEKCANSTKTACRCSCGGRLHGTGLIRDSLDVSPGDPSTVAFPPRRRKKRRILAVAIAVTVAGAAGGLTATGTFSSASGGSGDLSVKVNVDLKSIIAALSALEFGGKPLSVSGTTVPGNREGCAQSATRQVGQFLNSHHCEQYQAQVWEITRQGATARVAFSWVEMPTVSLAGQYRAEIDAYGTGNPPGISSAFDGRCYASDQQGSTVQTVEVEPTGNVEMDQQILRAAALRSLSLEYLREHCVV